MFTGNVNMDFMNLNSQGGLQAEGELANYFLQQGRVDPGFMRPWYDEKTKRSYVTIYSGGDPKKTSSYKAVPIQANATLRRDEWNQLDEALLRISEYRLGGVQDLIDSNLVYNIGNAMGTTVLEYHDISNAMEADMTMDGITRSQGDRPVYTSKYLPLPIIHVDFEINARVLAASRNLGSALDTESVERGGRKCNERLENLLFTNTTYAYASGTIYSYVNHPNRNTGSLTANWDASGTTGASILQDVLNMKQSSIDAYHYGPWKLYIPTGYETVLDDDYDATTPGTTIRERIMKIDGITGIKVVDTLSANNVLLVQMSTDVVRLVRGMALQTVEWTREGKFITKYKVLMIQVPQVRADQDGNSGIVHYS